MGRRITEFDKHYAQALAAHERTTTDADTAARYVYDVARNNGFNRRQANELRQIAKQAAESGLVYPFPKEH